MVLSFQTSLEHQLRQQGRPFDPASAQLPLSLPLYSWVALGVYRFPFLIQSASVSLSVVVLCLGGYCSHPSCCLRPCCHHPSDHRLYDLWMTPHHSSSIYSRPVHLGPPFAQARSGPLRSMIGVAGGISCYRHRHFHRGMISIFHIAFC